MKLFKIRDFLALSKYRFDIGITFMTFVNFSLLILTASSKLQLKWKVSTFNIWLIMLPIAFFGTWLFGFILDKGFKYQTAYIREAHSRSPYLTEILSLTRNINKRINEIDIKNDRKKGL